MKKVALLLVAAMLLCTCFALASCGDTQPATSEASKTESAPAEESKTEASTPAEASEPEASQPEESEEESQPEESEPAPVADAITLWLTHYEDGTKEGAGALFQNMDTAGAWWNHFSFKPVDADNGIYEVVETSYGVGSGAGAPLLVPEDGFVWAINTGNNWPELCQNGDYPEYANEPNYTSANCDNSIATTLASWVVGAKVQFTNLNLDSMEAPTSTPDKPWYDPDYVSTATWVLVD